MGFANMKDALARSRPAASLARRLWPEQIVDLDAGRTLFVRMDVTNACNLRCRMCHFSEILRTRPDFRREDMPFDLFRRIADMAFPRTRNLQLACAYESLLHPRIADMLELTGRYGIPSGGLVTNGMLLTPAVADALIASGLTDLSISIDSDDPATFESIRAGAKFDRVVGAARDFVTRRDAAGRRLPALRINHVLMASNVDRLASFARLCVDLGADCVVFVHVLPRTEENPEYLGAAPERFDRVRAEALGILEDAGVAVEMPLPFGEASPPETRASSEEIARDKHSGRPCRAPWRLLQVDHRGAVYPCAHRMGQGPYGYLAEQSLEAVFNNAKFLRLRSRLASGRPAGLCRGCRASEDPSFEDAARGR